MRTRAFIASPFRAIKIARPKWHEQAIVCEAQRIARLAALKVWVELKYIPFSPVLAYGNTFREFHSDKTIAESERQAATEACERELEHSDLFIWVECPYTQYSENMKIEQAKAQELGMKILTIEVIG